MKADDRLSKQKSERAISEKNSGMCKGEMRDAFYRQNLAAAL